MKAAVMGKLLALVAVLGALAAGGWWYMRDGQAAQYQTETLTRGRIEATVQATGTCNAVVTVQVGSQVSGNIKALFADFNTKVKKGQLVAQIDPDIFQARVNQAQAKLDSDKSAVVNARASLVKTDADTASARANLENMRASMTRARVTAEDAKSKLEHDNELFKRGIVAGEERDTAQATYDAAVASQQAAAAQVDAAQQGIKAAQAQHEVAQTQLIAAQAQERQSEAALRQAQIDLDHTQITAPVDGTVVARRMDVGQTVAASFQAPTIFEIAQDLTKMQVDTNVDEADIGQVRVGQTATFTVDAYPGEPFAGKVVQIRQAPNIVQNVVTYDVVIEVPNDDLKLYPGMTANVSVMVERRDEVLKLPNAALRVKLDEKGRPPQVGGAGAGRPKAGAGGIGRPGLGAGAGGGAKGGGAGVPGVGKGAGRTPALRRDAAPVTVWVLGPGGRPHAVSATLGISDGNYSAVESGELKEGDAVIVGVAVAQKSGGPFGGGTPARRPMGF